jgi:NAD(P)-dependent dehydrogenase (short-subunit alcohol dehydrogenase family)
MTGRVAGKVAFITGAARGQGRSHAIRLDIVSATAGISSVGPAVDLPEQTWRDMIEVNLTGVWHTTKVTIPHLVAGGRGGAIVLTNSADGRTSDPCRSSTPAALSKE